MRKVLYALFAISAFFFVSTNALDWNAVRKAKAIRADMHQGLSLDAVKAIAVSHDGAVRLSGEGELEIRTSGWGLLCHVRAQMVENTASSVAEVDCIY